MSGEVRGDELLAEGGCDDYIDVLEQFLPHFHCLHARAICLDVFNRRCEPGNTE